MSVLKNTGSRSNRWSIGLGVLLAIAACGGEETSPDDDDDDDDTESAESSSTDEDDDEDDDSTGGSTRTDAGKKDGGAGAIDSGGPKPLIDAGSKPSTDGGGKGGSSSDGSMGGPQPGGNANLVKCDTTTDATRTGPCGSFVSSLGVEFDLGPYGGQMDDPNVGQGFETADEGGADLICGVFVASFGEDPEASERLLNVEGLDMTLFTVYRPANWPEGKVPIVTWGNGTCAQPEGYGGILRYIASHGFFVVAANNRFVGDGTAQRKAIDYALAANEDPDSPYYGKLDPDKIIAMGHSQGGLGTSTATRADERIKAALLFNGGTSATKPFMAISGDRDLGTAEGPSAAESYGSQVMASTQPTVAWMWFHMIPGSGHVTLMTQPERVGPPAVAWAKYILLDDPEAKAYFSGPDCELCNKEDDFRFGQKGID